MCFLGNFIYFHLLPQNSMETSTEVNLVSWKLVEVSMEVDLIPWKLVEASKGVDRNFHWKYTKKTYSVKACVCDSCAYTTGRYVTYPFTTRTIRRGGHMHPISCARGELVLMLCWFVLRFLLRILAHRTPRTGTPLR